MKRILEIGVAKAIAPMRKLNGELVDHARSRLDCQEAHIYARELTLVGHTFHLQDSEFASSGWVEQNPDV